MVMKASPEEIASRLGAIGRYVGAALTAVQEWAWLLIPLLLVFAWTLSGVKKHYGDPEIWKEIQKLIDSIRSEVFGKVQGYQHHYRVTLYKYHHLCLTKPRLAWLLPVVRSGHTSKNDVREFSVDRRKAGCAKGVAGRAWESEGAIHIEQLPDIISNDDEELLREYARLTNVDVEDLMKKKSHSQSFWAVRVEKKGEPWGVLVIDTIAPQVSKKNADEAFSHSAQFLSLLLQRA